MALVDIDNEKGRLARDTNTMAIISVDKSAVLRDQEYKNKLTRNKEVDFAINKLNDDVANLKSSIDKILEILSSRG